MSGLPIALFSGTNAGIGKPQHIDDHGTHMKTPDYRAIRKMVLTSMILVPFIPFVLIMGVGFYYFKNAVEDDAINYMERVASDHRHFIESFLDERRQDLEFAGRTHGYDALVQPGMLERVFERLRKESRAFVDLGVFDKDGLHVAYCGPYELGGKHYRDADWFKAVTRHGYYISNVFTGYRNIPHFVIAVLMYDQSAKWVLRATVDTLTFDQLVQDIRIGRTGEAYILDTDGILQTARRSGGALMEKTNETIRAPSAPGDIMAYIDRDASGKAFLYTTAWLNDQSWLLVVRQEKSDAFRLLHSTILMTAVIALAGGGAIVLTAVHLTDRIVRRIERTDAEKERLNQQLIGASRLAELGEMAAGFAHEINNPLQIIKSEKTLMEMSLKELKANNELTDEAPLLEIEDAIRQIDLQISRCSRITQSILKFGRQNDPNPQDIPLQQFIPEIVGMVAQRAAVHGISIHQYLDEAAVAVVADSAQLQQVFLNLFNNAIDAIIEQHGTVGGEMVVAAQPTANGCIDIQIRDNGCGISPDNLKKIFSPFFTTKPVGKGTGLGLSVCYGIIGGMGGRMAVDSTPGIGTVFSIRLPVAA